MPFCSKCGTNIPAEAAFCPNCGRAVSQPIPTPQAGSANEFDSLVKDSNAQEHWIFRLIAFIIDWIIVGIAFYVISLLAFFAVSRSLSIFGIFGFIPTLGGLGEGIVLVLYFAIAETYYGRTFGKSLLHLRVVTVNGGRLDFSKSIIRNISKIYWVLLLLDILGGLLSKSRRGQKYSDIIANTNVIKDVA